PTAVPLSPSSKRKAAMATMTTSRVPRDSSVSTGDYGEAFPSSRKVYVEGRGGVRVPMREIVLTGDNPALRVYDTSGPRGYDVRLGLPALRATWIRARGDVEEVQ